LPNGFTRSSKLTQTLPIDAVNKASIRVVIGTTAVGTGVFNRSATTGVTIGVTASGQQTDQQHYGTATVGVVISSTASASVTSTHSGTATASIVITATAAGETGATHAGTANIGVTISATASGTASQTHTGTASCQVNLSVSAAGINTNTTVPDETSNGNNMTLYADGSGTKYAYSSDAAIGTRSVEFEGDGVQDGTGGYAIIDNTFQSTFRSSFSVSAWVKFDDGDAGLSTILSNFPLGGDGGNNNYVKLEMASGDPRFWYKSGTATKLAWDLDYDLADGQSGWIHLVGTYNATDDNAYLYVNGTEVASDTTTNIDPTQYTNSVNLRVNKHEDTNSNYIYTGKKIDDISIWSKALSSTEVSNLYNSGNGTSLTGSSDLEGWWKMGDHSVVPITHSGTATVSVAVTASADGTASTTHSGTASCQVNLSASASGSVSTPWANSYSIDLDGTNDWVKVSNHSTLTFGDGSNDSAFSVSAWIKADNFTNFRIVSKGEWNSSTNYREFIFNASNGVALLGLIDADGSSNAYQNYRYRASATTSLQMSTGTWYHVVGTYDGRGGTNAHQGIKLYVDGVVETNYNDYTGGTYVAMHNNTGSNGDIAIGAWRNDTFSNGKIDEFAIFSTELTGTQVSNIYNSGTPTDLSGDSNLEGYWRFEENSGTSIADSSTNSNTATLNNGPTFSIDVPS
jgi:hypothetical protein